MNTEINLLLDRLEGAPLSVSDKALLANLATELVTLTSRRLAGEEVDSELAHVKAQTANLTSAALSTFQLQFTKWTHEIIGIIVARAL